MAYPSSGSGSIPNPLPVAAPAGGMPVKSAAPLDVNMVSPTTMPISAASPLPISGTASNGTTSTGNPLVVAGVTATGAMTADTAGLVSRLTMTSAKQLVVKPYGLPETDWQYAAAAGGITNTTPVQIKGAPGAGFRNYITEISVQNGTALGVLATEFVISDGTTVLFRGFCGVGANVQAYFNTPRRPAANAALTVQCTVALAQIYVNVAGYVAP